MSHCTTETFFRPPEWKQHTSTLPAALLNAAQLLFMRSQSDYLFVPIRSMQYLAVVNRDETIFVDSQAYAVQDGVGGRLVVIAWQPLPTGQRTSLSGPVPCSFIFYRAGLAEIQRRLLGEYEHALRLLGERARDRVTPLQGACIIPFRNLPTSAG